MNLVLRTEGYNPAIQEALFDIRDLDAVIEVLKNSKTPFVALIGKDPTAHPQYFEFIEKCLSREIYVRTVLDTIPNRDILERLGQMANNVNNEEYEQVGFMLDLTQYDHNNSTMAAAIKYIGRWSTTNFVLGHESIPLRELYKVVIDNKMIPLIKVGTALPIPNSPYKPLTIEEYREKIKELTADTDFRRQYGISLILDCGFTACDFTKEMIGDLYMSPMSYMGLACAPKIEILPGLRIAHCAVLAGEYTIRLQDFSDIQEISNYLNIYFKEYAPLYNKCTNCWFHNVLCGGGCKGYKLNQNKEEQNEERNV